MAYENTEKPSAFNFKQLNLQPSEISLYMFNKGQSTPGLFDGKAGGSIFTPGGGGAATDLIGSTKIGSGIGGALGKVGGAVSKVASSLNPIGMIGGAVAGVAGIVGGLLGSGARRRRQQKAKKQYDKMMGEYRGLDTSNIYANVENQYSDMENVYEDMTVNQQQAQFEAQQGMQQRANIMQNLSGAAGSSGIAGLAQAMAAQGQLATQRASASIGQQESRIQQLQAGEASKLQRMERAGEAQAEAQRLAGATTSRNLEYQKTGTQLAMAQQRLASAEEAQARAKQNIMGGIAQIGGAFAGGVGS